MQEHVSDLKPGERADILYRVLPNTSQVVISLSNVTLALPPAQQSQLFGDDILLAVHTSKTSGIDDYPVFTFTTGGTFVVNNPETGLMRITVNGDWTNAGNISAHLAILSIKDPVPQLTTQWSVSDGQTLAIPISIPPGVSKAEFRLIWREDWSNYPTGDVVMILMAPGPIFNFNGATLNNPEGVVVNNPAVVLVDGFEVPVGTDKFELRVALDGRVVK